MRRVSRISVVAAGILILTSVVFHVHGGEELPRSLRGFSGQVRGVVVEKGQKNNIDFKVGRVLRVWEGNKAEKAEGLVGRTVSVGPRWVKGEGGRWRPTDRHVVFIQGLSAGREMTLEIANVEGSHFHILELSEEQKRTAEGKGDRRERDRPREGGEGDRRDHPEARREGGERDHPEARRDGVERDRREGGERDHPEARREGVERDRREGGERDHPEARREGGDGDRREGGDRDRPAEREGDERVQRLEREIRILREELDALRRRLRE